MCACVRVCGRVYVCVCSFDFPGADKFQAFDLVSSLVLFCRLPLFLSLCNVLHMLRASLSPSSYNLPPGTAAQWFGDAVLGLSWELNLRFLFIAVPDSIISLHTPVSCTSGDGWSPPSSNIFGKDIYRYNFFWIPVYGIRYLNQF